MSSMVLRAFGEDSSTLAKMQARPGARIFSAGHRMRGYELASAWMVVRRRDDLLLGGAYVNHCFVLGLRVAETVEDVAYHPDGGSHRDGHDYYVAAVYAFFIADNLVGEFHLGGGLRIDRIGFHAENRAGEAPALEIHGHRAAYETESYYSYCHVSSNNFIPVSVLRKKLLSVRRLR